ncbi:MAG: ADP-ribosylglycohydrolase family protein [bacterium]|nr:ADP-ribosylglycohydrolase family protein [bacterium]
MTIPFDFDIDVRNYLHLLDEQGMDVRALLRDYETLSAHLPPAARASDPHWQALAQNVVRAADTWQTAEPSARDKILAARPAVRHDAYAAPLAPETLRSKIAGGWRARIAGCVLGKPVEGLMGEPDSRKTLRAMLAADHAYPLTDFVPEAVMERHWQARFAQNPPQWYLAGHGRDSLRGRIAFAPVDDDLNYTVLGLEILREYGRAFTPDNVLEMLTRLLPYDSVYTAERAAYRNYVLGLRFPRAATFLNPYCEWIGAQIRADAYGYVCPGQPAQAAQLAWQDAAATHIKNGIYGAMWTAAALAAAFYENDPETIIRRGLEQVPDACRFAEQIKATIAAATRNGDDFEKTFDDIQARVGSYHCVHTINNACVVAAALLHGGHDLSRVMCIAVMGGWDTDCNGATAGSIAGVMLGEAALESRWITPFNDTLHTSLCGHAALNISELITRTCALAQ